MKRILHCLLLGSDLGLERELQVAAAELPDDTRLVLQTVSDRRRGIEHALNRRPDLVLLELEGDPAATIAVAREIAAGPGAPPLACAYRPRSMSGDERSDSALIELMRAGARDFLRRPVSTAELEGLLRRLFPSGERAGGRRGRVLSFLGTKGGVGKSTLSLNLACTLARRAPGRVLVVDASLQHGTICELLDLEPEATLRDVVTQIDRLDERLLRTLSTEHECGLRVLAAPRNAIEAAPVDDQMLARILSVARTAFDHVIVDTFPLLDPVTLAVLDVSDLLFVVLNDFVPSVLGTAELLGVLERLGVPAARTRVVLNQSHPWYRGRLRAADVAARLERELDFFVPFARKVLVSTNSGAPYALGAPRWTGFQRALRRMARELEQEPAPQEQADFRVDVDALAAEGAPDPLAVASPPAPAFVEPGREP